MGLGTVNLENIIWLGILSTRLTCVFTGAGYWFDNVAYYTFKPCWRKIEDRLCCNRVTGHYEWHWCSEHALRVDSPPIQYLIVRFLNRLPLSHKSKYSWSFFLHFCLLGIKMFFIHLVICPWRIFRSKMLPQSVPTAGAVIWSVSGCIPLIAWYLLFDTNRKLSHGHIVRTKLLN